MLCKIFLPFLLLLASIGAQSLNAQDKFLLSKHRAGEVEIGMTIDALHTKYKPQLTKLVAHYPEGMFSPMLEIYLDGAAQRRQPSLLVGIDKANDWVVRSISVKHRRFRTAEGIGVGSTLGEIRRAYKVNWIDFGEGPLFANVEEIGMSFELNLTKPSEDWYRSREQSLIPDSAKVVSVNVYWDPDEKASGDVRPE